jgi:hypothetical protein
VGPGLARVRLRVLMTRMISLAGQAASQIGRLRPGTLARAVGPGFGPAQESKFGRAAQWQPGREGHGPGHRRAVTGVTAR